MKLIAQQQDHARTVRRMRNMLFTKIGERAYMRSMGLPALKERFEILTAQTRTRSEEVSRVGEIVSVEILNLARATKKLTLTLRALRSLLITSEKEVVSIFNRACDPEQLDMEGCATAMAMIKPFAARAGRPYFACPDGTSVLTTAERLESAALGNADGRHARKFAKHIREAADDSERQRQRFMRTLHQCMERFEATIAERFEPGAFRREYVKVLGRSSIDRYPVINAYLAR